MLCSGCRRRELYPGARRHRIFRGFGLRGGELGGGRGIATVGAITRSGKLARLCGASLAALVIGLAIGACGSSTTPHGGTAVASVPPAAGALGSAPQAVRVGASAATTSAPAVSSRGALTRINVVCTAILHGFPRPLSRPYTEAGLIRFANGAAPPARRAAVSLERLEPLGDRAALRALDTEWQQLEALYGSIGTLSRDRHAVPGLGAEILARDQQLNALTLSDRLPACGVPVQ